MQAMASMTTAGATTMVTMNGRAPWSRYEAPVSLITHTHSDVLFAQPFAPVAGSVRLKIGQNAAPSLSVQVWRGAKIRMELTR